MDVIRESKDKKNWMNNKLAIVGGVCLLIVLAVYARNQVNAVSVDRTDILVGVVKNGDIEVTVEGYGTLKSEKQQLITTLTSATVKNIILKPGARVTKDDVIVELENPELLQRVETASQDLALEEADLRQLKLNQKRELLDEKAKVAELNALYESAKLKRDAEKKLIANGVVSMLTFKKSVLDERQLGQQLTILTERLSQLAMVHEEAINIKLKKIEQLEGRLALEQQRLDKMTVKAGFEGVLQRLSVELGQSLSPGQEIALIGSVVDLVALIKVPQNQAPQINIGQKAIIDTRRDKINGHVIRIDPTVVDNTVSIEVALPRELPESARPQLSVDGVVIVESLSNVNYIERPAVVNGRGEHELYRIDSSQDNAELKRLRFGRQAGRYIEIVAGAKANESYIISDLSHLQAHESELAISR